jgi:ElaB/YqjD/DUF883 family membrane-anchored ribosome-binding protein
MGQSTEELRRDIEQTRDGLSDTLDAIGDRVSPGRVLERRKNRAVQSFQSLRDRLMGTVSSAKDGLSDGAGSAVDTITSTPDAVRAQTQGSPLATGAIAFGVGFLIAAVLPPSQPEQDAAQGLLDKAEPLKDELLAAGHDAADELKDSARAALDEVKDTAADSKQAIADTAHERIDATKDTATAAADSVKDANN